MEDVEPAVPADPILSAHAWLARFAPLMFEESALSVDDARARIAEARRLRAEWPELAARLRDSADAEDVRDTLERSAQQLDSLESDFRRRLARLAPGDPDGIVDLDQLHERLDEREARQELGLDDAIDTSIPLRLPPVDGNLAAAAFLGLFGLAWTGFTLFHSIMMIGGMWQVAGPFALLLLLFYALFFGVGFGMLFAAFRSAAREAATIDGSMLIIERTLGPCRRTDRIELDVHVAATVGTPSAGGRAWPLADRAGKASPSYIILTTARGKPVAIGAGQSDEALRVRCDQINAYLLAQR